MELMDGRFWRSCGYKLQRQARLHRESSPASINRKRKADSMVRRNQMIGIVLLRKMKS
ncbi:MAG: hypothetical protein NC548_25235 [Lachnospiraceae bacterium]|nr:hypothetical protein [Lachnospiraceae bacterium]